MTTIVQWVALYVILSGLYAYWCFSDLETDFNDWCNRHKDDKDYYSKRNELYSYILEFQEEPIMPIVLLTFGWFITPYLFTHKLVRVAKDLFNVKDN